jgi:hypothetical protein
MVVECVVLLCCGGCDYGLGDASWSMEDALSADVLVRYLFLAGNADIALRQSAGAWVAL